MEGLVSEGQHYRIVHWSPDLKSSVYYADIGVNAHPVPFGTDDPLVVMANPIVYKWKQGMPRSLRKSHPYYWDDPEKYVNLNAIVGFGSHGVETRVGTRTKEDYGTLISVVQEHINRIVRLSLKFGVI